MVSDGNQLSIRLLNKEISRRFFSNGIPAGFLCLGLLGRVLVKVLIEHFAKQLDRGRCMSGKIQNVVDCLCSLLAISK